MVRCDEEVVDRYSGLARAAMAGETVIDSSPDSFDQGCFGTAGYDDTTGLPGGALRASLGCGNPVAVAELRRGETVLDLGSGGGIDVLLSARRVGAHGKVYGLDASPDMVELARRNAAEAGAANAEFLHGTIEAIPLPGHVSITLTAEHGDGVHSAIIQAAKPAISPGLEIRPMREADAEQVLAIYQAGLDTGQASFETIVPSWDGFTPAKLPYLRYVATDTETGQVVGWVAASAVSAGRCTPESWSTASMFIPAARRTASAARYSPRSSSPPRTRASGPFSRASSPRTPPASPSIRHSASAWSAHASASAVTTASGATSSSSNAAALPLGTKGDPKCGGAIR
jgi:SAM-dependent methyltransferase